MSDYSDPIWTNLRGMYYDRQGNEINLRQWCELHGDNADPDKRMQAIHVENDRVDDAQVSTVWIGINHRFGPGPPLIFETMVFGGPLDQDQRRYATEDEARLGHAEILAEVREAAVAGRAREPEKNIVQQFIEAIEEAEGG